jgi:phage terminase small subunit
MSRRSTKKKDELSPRYEAMSRPEVEDQLTDKEAMFCQQYLVHFNAKRALREAGYSDGMLAHNIMKRPIIKRYISILQDDLIDRLKVSQERVITEIAASAFFNPADLYDEQGKLLPATSLPSHAVRALKKIREKVLQVGDNGEKILERQYEMNDKLGALDMLAKHLGLYEKDNDQKKAFAQMVFMMPDNGRNTDMQTIPVKPEDE